MKAKRHVTEHGDENFEQEDNGKGDDDDDELEVVSCVIAPKAKASSSDKASCFNSVKDHSQQNMKAQNELSSQSQARQSKSGTVANDSSNKKKDKGFTRGGATNEALEVVESRRGLQPLVDYPHFRFQCAIHPFKRQRIQRKKLICPKCFCYVCDILAEKCGQWDDHCKATDSQSFWQSLRRSKMDDRKKLAVDPAKRGTQPSRVAMPLVVQGVLSDDGSEKGEDGGEEHANMELMENADWYANTKPDVPNDFDQSLRSMMIDSNHLSFSELSSCLLYTSPSPRDLSTSRMPSSA